MNPIVRITIHFISFAFSMLALGSLDFNKFLKKNRVWQAQLLYIILAMVLGYAVAQFLINIMYQTLS
ncbi:MAG: DUF1146 domain-containing protein [Erysipelothrix sp.]|nr:DUF1146 domain-containing protein [Erysipelothrix sp.]